MASLHAADAQIVPFRAEHASAFYSLNRAWLDAHDLYEPPDEAQLVDPMGTIVANSGAIFIAVRGEQVVGTAAVMLHAPGEFALVKLTVSDAERGRGLGRRLVDKCVAFARDAGGLRLVLVSSSRLSAALRLYEAMGFVHKPMPDSVPYETADVYMELSLGA